MNSSLTCKLLPETKDREARTEATDQKFTVLGAGGFIGSHLGRYLRRNGYECQTPARDDPSIYTSPLGHVIYAIGMTADFRERPLETVEAHVCLLRKLLHVGHFDSLTYLSSTRVYAGAEDTSENATLHVNPNEPGDLYNLSKLMGESLCMHSGRSRTKVIRLSNVVGLGGDRKMFINQLLEEGLESGKVVFGTTLESSKDYIFVDDAIDLIAQIALSQEAGIYNVASGKGTKNRQIADALVEHLGVEVSIAPDARAWDFIEIDIRKLTSRFARLPRPFADFFPLFLERYRQRKEI